MAVGQATQRPPRTSTDLPVNTPAAKDNTGTKHQASPSTNIIACYTRRGDQQPLPLPFSSPYAALPVLPPLTSASTPSAIARVQPKTYLPVLQRSLPPTFYPTRFVRYLRGRPNVRIHHEAVGEVFPRTPEPPRTARNLAEQILCLLDLKTILHCQRISRQMRGLITKSINLQRRLWFADMDTFTLDHIIIPDNPNFIDASIRDLRSAFDLFFHYDPNSIIQKILYIPSGGSVVPKDTPTASWRRMAVMRSAARGKYWRVVIAGQGYINLGIFPTSPTFGQVVDAIHDVMLRGGRRYGVIGSRR